MKINVEDLLINSVFLMRLVLLTIVLTLNMPVKVNAQTGKANFTGNWVFNLSKSTPSVRGPRDSEKSIMVVSQNENALTTTKTITHGDTIHTTRSTTFNIDGKENVLTPWSAVGTPPKYVATWSDNGEILVIVTTSTTQKGDIKTTQVWKLVNANTLSIIYTNNISGTEQKTVDIYEKNSTELPKMANTLSKIPTSNTIGTEQTTENISEGNSTDLPKIDLHAHLNWTPQSQTYTAAIAYEKASLLSKKMGVTLGIAEEFASNNLRFNDSLLLACIALAKKNSLYIGLQVSRRDWYNRFSKEILNQLDYILADALVFPNKDGRIISIWIPGMPLGEPQEFMDLYVAHNLQVLSEPITIWANPTYLPDALNSRYDELWTDARMKRLINAAVKNNVAIEINSRYKVPNAKFIKMAKVMGAHFTFGSNQHDVGFGEITWSINMAKECGLSMKDFFIPKRKL